MNCVWIVLELRAGVAAERRERRHRALLVWALSTANTSTRYGATCEEASHGAILRWARWVWVPLPTVWQVVRSEKVYEHFDGGRRMRSTYASERSHKQGKSQVVNEWLHAYYAITVYCNWVTSCYSKSETMIINEISSSLSISEICGALSCHPIQGNWSDNSRRYQEMREVGFQVRRIRI